jgi:hypothetical protein
MSPVTGQTAFASILLAAKLLSGCASMTPTQKRVAGAAASILVIGAIAARDPQQERQRYAIPSDPCSTPGACQ